MHLWLDAAKCYVNSGQSCPYGIERIGGYIAVNAAGQPIQTVVIVVTKHHQK
jgi:hypothetical protein